MAALFDYDEDREAASAAKVRALEALLIKKGVLGSDSVDAVLSHFETVAGPFNGARIVARAWLDSAYKRRLLDDTPKAIAELQFPGMTGAEGEHMKAVANSAIRAQFDHLYPVLVLSVAGVGPAALLVQGSGVPLARRT